MQRFKNILVYLNLSKPEAGMIHYAAAFAKMSGAARVELLNVIPDETFDMYDSDAAANEAWVVNRLNKKILEYKKLLLSELTESKDIVATIKRGNVVNEILAHSLLGNYDLIIVGKDDTNFLLAEKISRKAACSVLTLEQTAQPNFKKILLPVDFSEQTADCLKIGSSIALRNQDSKLFPLNCIEIPPFYMNATTSIDDKKAELKTNSDRKMKHLLENIESPELIHRYYLMFDDCCWQGIQAFSEELHPDLIIMGNRGTHSKGKLLLGGTAEQTLRLSHAPILIFKKTGTGASVLKQLLDLEN